MKKLIKLYAIALYLLTILVFFIVGMFYVKFTGAAEGQGLAGGAILVFNGAIFSFLAFIVSLFVAYYGSRKMIVGINILLLVLFILAILYFVFFNLRKNEQNPASMHLGNPGNLQTVTQVALLSDAPEFTPPAEATGMGFFKPDFFSRPVLYFYGNPNLEKSILEHAPADSIVFERQEYGGYDIVYAPPWLQPHHLKLDYDILYFKIETIGQEFIEVFVNTTNQKKMYVNRFQGEVIFWPDFLLGVASIEFLPDMNQPVKIKPLDHASDIRGVEYSYMKPLLVRGDWVKVMLQDEKLRNAGSGWLRWQQDGQFLIKYALLS